MGAPRFQRKWLLFTASPAIKTTTERAPAQYVSPGTGTAAFIRKFRSAGPEQCQSSAANALYRCSPSEAQIRDLPNTIQYDVQKQPFVLQFRTDREIVLVG